MKRLESDTAIKEALLRVMRSRTLDSVSVAELARQAQVSRTTFYAHFNSVYEVFQALIGDYMADVQSLDGRLSDMRPHAPRTYPDSNGVADGPGEARPSCRTDCIAIPYCQKIRSAGKYAPVVADPRFLPELLRSDHSIDREFFSERLAGSSLSRRQIKALCVFQMNGCHALATSGLASEGDWPELQETIDAFIDGGITALGKKHAALTGTQAAEQGVS